METENKTEVTKESRMYIIPLSYLHEGTRFVAYGGNNAMMTGVAAMDGHAVSNRYGMRQGNTYYSDNPERNYINVWFDGVEYGNHPCDRDKRGNRLPINSGLYERDKFRIFVDKDAYDRYKEDVKWTPQTDEEKAREAKKAALLAQIDALKAEAESL